MLKRCLKLCLVLTLFGLLASTAQAQDTLHGPGDKFKADLIGFEEVPALSNPGAGTFNLIIRAGDTEFDYELSYSGTQGTVTQAHTHIAQKGVNGGIIIFFCTNLGNGPPGTQACPASGTITGTITAADVLAASGQGISAGEFAEVLRAIRAGSTYANVHSTVFPGGEIRGQIVKHPK